MSDSYTLEQYVQDLKRIAAESGDEGEIFERLGPLAQRLALDKGWLEARHYEIDPAVGYGSFLLHEEADHGLAVFVASWAPGRGVVPHDHGTWAVVAGVEGVERNVRYKRLDDRATSGHAELAVKAEMTAGPGELICMRSGGIHSVHNDGDAVSVSLHTYGRHLNDTNRSQFDLEAKTETPFIIEVR
jgi:predicted metal-dependent enzyme (double-stranded beta helix superfamily)